MSDAQRAFYGWKLLFVLWLGLAVVMGSTVYGAGVINAAMAPALHLDRSSLGGGFALFQWMSGLPAPLVALCVNRKGARFTLALGSVILLAGAAAMALFVRTGLQFSLVFGVVIGLAAVTAGPLAAQAVVARWFTRRRARAMALLLTAPAFGGFVAAPLFNGVITAHHGDWRAGWWVIAGGAVLTGLASVFLVRNAPEDIGQAADGGGAVQGGPPPLPEGASPDMAAIVRTPAFLVMLLAVIGLFGGFMLFAAHGALHLRDVGFSPAQTAASVSVVFLSLLCGNLLFAAIGDHVQPRYLLTAAALMLGLGLLLVIKPAGAPGLYLYAVLLGGGFGLGFSSLMVLPGVLFGQQAYVSIIGMLLALSTTAGALAAFGAGVSFDHWGGYAIAFRVAAGLSLLGGVLALWLRPPPAPAG